MFLMTFDIIDSRNKNKSLIDILNSTDYLSEIREEYEIEMKNIQLNEGDQIRMLLSSSKNMIGIIFSVLTLLVQEDFKARVFITKGNVKNNIYKSLAEADGDIFYKNKELEKRTKEDKNLYKSKDCLIRYYDNDDSNIVDILFLTISKISLKKENNIATLYNYLYKGKTQSEIAKEFGVEQRTISKRLKASDISFLQIVIKEIENLLKEG